MRVEYRPKNGEWATAAFFTKMPGEFTVTPQTAGQPETEHVRGIFIKKNEPVGVPSADYPLTVSKGGNASVNERAFSWTGESTLHYCRVSVNERSAFPRRNVA
jgi:hypothetical protein